MAPSRPELHLREERAWVRCFGVTQGQSSLHRPTFDVVLGFTGEADPAVVLSVDLDLADVGAHTAGKLVIGDA